MKALCPTCRSPVKILGHDMHYEPIHAHDRSYIGALSELDAARERIAALRMALAKIEADRSQKTDTEHQLRMRLLFTASVAYNAIFKDNGLCHDPWPNIAADDEAAK